MKAPPLFSLTYISSACTPCTPRQLQDLAASSAHHNACDDVTGALLYKEGTFMQVLEGHETAARAVFARIGSDARHRGIILLLQGKIQQRQFPDWSMRVTIIDAQSGAEPPGEFVSALLAQPRPEAPTPTQKLLMTFAGLPRDAARIFS
jgi:hypothetical protein